MKKLERQTTLTMAELLKAIHGDSPYPECGLLNEIGAACQQGEDTDGAGEKYLLSALNDERKHIRAIAYCCLSCIEGATEEHFAIMDSFLANPENEPLLDFINKSLQ